MVNRRAFIGGAVAGSAAAAGGMAWLAPPLPEYGRVSYAQQGEDIVVFHALRELLDITAPTYLDIGAAHPVRGSNTYLLYTTGARGVLVEPNPVLADLLRRQRAGDVVIEAGIGVTDITEADYYEIEGNPMLNTFSAEQVARLERGSTGGVVARVVKKPLLTIDRVIREHWGRAPDLLSTDVEGWDDAIIQSLNLSAFRPAVICAETVPMRQPGQLSGITEYLVAQEYVPRGGSMYNTVFLDTRRL